MCGRKKRPILSRLTSKNVAIYGLLANIKEAFRLENVFVEEKVYQLTRIM
jgi:hypothetical protein